MICPILQTPNLKSWIKASGWLQHRSVPDPEVEKAVSAILTDVRERGDAALLDYTRKYDCENFEPPFRVSEQQMALAAASISAESRQQISDAAANIRAFHEAELEKSWFMTRKDGTILGQQIQAIEAVGLYVPGGKGGETPLISSLLMNAIPAQVAGCERIAVITPPTKSGEINPFILACAHMLDIEEIYRVGSAWGMAALAYGTSSIPAVDMLAGPGNIYVTTAKKMLHGLVGIDMLAGPSEVLIVADSSANPDYVAADMISQAEHDKLASAICLTTDAHLADGVAAELSRQLLTLPRAEIAKSALENWSCICVCPNIQTAMEIANKVAPEHLELCVRDPWGVMPLVRNAGAVFMGQNCPEPVGDYFAGPNHVLPTLGTARFSSSLSTMSFCKKTNIIAASRKFLQENSEAIAALARLEGLEGHARSIEARKKRPNDS